MQVKTSRIAGFVNRSKTRGIQHFSWYLKLISSFRGSRAHEPRTPTRPELILVSVAWSNWEYCYSPLDGMLVHRRVTPSGMSPVPIYTPGWRETMWGKVSCPRKHHDSKEWASNHRSSDLKSNALTTTPPRPHFRGSSKGIITCYQAEF